MESRRPEGAQQRLFVCLRPLLAGICLLLVGCSSEGRDGIWRKVDPLGYSRVHDEPYLYRANNQPEKRFLSSPDYEMQRPYLPDN